LNDGTLMTTIISLLLSTSSQVGQPRRIENAKILIANTPMDTDKIKIYGSRVSVCVILIDTRMMIDE